MKTIGVVTKWGHSFWDKKHPSREWIKELTKSVSKMNKKTAVNGVVGIALLIGAVAVVTPIVKAQLQRGNVEDIELVTLQQDTADFIKLNTLAVNFANSTLEDIYLYVENGFTEEQRAVLLSKKEGLMDYKKQLTPTNPLFMELSENTNNKMNILLSAIDNFLDSSTTSEEDIATLNMYTNEYKKATEREQHLLIQLLEQAGMSYEILPNGQIHYSYMTQ